MSTQLVQHNMNDLTQMAEAVARSGLFGMKSWEQALALMLVAQSENQHPATITQEYDIIQGKACRKTHSVMARFQQMNGKVEWHELTDAIADATFSHPAGGAVRMTWTFEQANKAGLTNKDNWKNYPRAMLRARCIAEGIRTVYPAAIGGMLLAEEVQDIAPDIPRAASNITTIDGNTGEVLTKREPPALPAYSDAAFAANFPKWVDLIEAGKKTAGEIIAMVSSKAVLTEDQQIAIRDVRTIIEGEAA